MAEIISRNLMAVLLLITILMTTIGTWAALISLSEMEYTDVPTEPIDPTAQTGRVSVYLVPPPMSLTGNVSLNLIDLKEGG